MAVYSTAELNTLVKNGIQTVEFIQQAPKNPKETYGRSAIQKPTTRDRVKAWEGVNPNPDHDYTGGDSSNKAGGSKTSKEGKSQGDSQADGRSGGEETKPQIGQDSKAGNRESGDAADSSAQHTAVGGDANPKLPGSGENRPAGGEGNPASERSIGDDSVSNEEFRVILGADHETSALETTGSSPVVINIRDATTEDFAQIFEEGPSKVHRRLSGIAAYSGSDQTKQNSGNPVKKGIAESTASTHLVDVPSSESGAIPNVHQLLLRQPSSNAHAESAPEGVSNVSTTGSTYKSCETASYNPDVEGKIDLLIDAVDRISRKLDLLPEVKEEIKNINKKITTLSLGLSVVENYIKSMMIMIPSSGKNDADADIETNPDLRPVIGRDGTRALEEMTLKRGDLEDLDSDRTPQSGDDGPQGNTDKQNPKNTGKEERNKDTKPSEIQHKELDPKYDTKPLDFSESNASNFVPKNDYPSYMTIIAMIKNEIDDISTRESLIKWVDANVDKVDMKDIYHAIRESLDGIEGDEDEDQ